MMGCSANQLSCFVLCYLWTSDLALSFLFPLASLLEKPSRRTLESDPSCGLTTEGAEECWWDCSIVPARGLVITNPECFRDCFPSQHCVTGLLQDLHRAGGICKDSYGDRNFPGLYNISRTVSCRLSGGKIERGICSPETERKLRLKRACMYKVYSSPAFIFNIVVIGD